MTRVVSILLLFVGLAWAQNSWAQDAATAPSTPAPVVDANAPVLAFDSETFDFGTVKQGDIVKHVFTFTNKGKSDLILSSVKPGCGCTSPKWTNTPVKPNEKGEIEVSFNTAGKMGFQTKNVAITYNGEPAVKQIFIKGTIEAAEAPAATPSN